MPESSTYLAFLGALLAYQLSGPGPDMLLVISRGIAQGRQAALATAIGCVSAGAIQIPLLALGLASIINASTIAHEVMRWGGAASLCYLGAALLFKSAKATARAEMSPITRTDAFQQGVISNLTNPTTLAFMLALLPQFVDPSTGSTTTQLIVLGVTKSDRIDRAGLGGAGCGLRRQVDFAQTRIHCLAGATVRLSADRLTAVLTIGEHREAEVSMIGFGRKLPGIRALLFALFELARRLPQCVFPHSDE